MVLKFDEDPDDIAHPHPYGMQLEIKYALGKERYLKEQEYKRLEWRIKVRKFSTYSLAGALLQFAKQGISTVHGNKENCPDGRYIGSQPLKTIIWEGRNQALHWEEGNFKNKRLCQCFDTLAKEIDPKFANYTTQNMALDIVELLGWTTFTAFKRDLLLLEIPSDSQTV